MLLSEELADRGVGVVLGARVRRVSSVVGFIRVLFWDDLGMRVGRLGEKVNHSYTFVFDNDSILFGLGDLHFFTTDNLFFLYPLYSFRRLNHRTRAQSLGT